MRKTIDRAVKYLFFSLASLSTIVIFLIFLFLFRESVGLLGEQHLEYGTCCIVNHRNPVSLIRAEDIVKIKNDEITNWIDIGWRDNPIQLYDDDIVEDMEQTVIELVSGEANAVGIIFEDDLAAIQELPVPSAVRVVEVEKIGMANILFGRTWMPTGTPANLFGFLPLISGTLWVTLLSLMISVPVSLGCSIFISEIVNNTFKEILKPVIEVLAGIPSVVYGFFGLVAVVPVVKDLFNLQTGETAISGAVVLGIMCLPTIVSISEDAISSVPGNLKEASLALGASHWQTIYRVILPCAKSGVIASIILGVGRAIGETMTVLMITGNAAVMPHTMLQPVRTLTATIAAELGEAVQGSTHYFALFGIAVILFGITFVVNLIADIAVSGRRRS